jgi:hypothetical protein
MTISEKLSFAILIALGVQLSAGAFFDDIQSEKTLILSFAQDLRNQDSTQAQKIARWLDQQVIGSSTYRAAIVNIITNNDLTEKSKITLLSEMISKQKDEDLKGFLGSLCGGVLCAGTLAAFVWLAIEEAKNPRPVWVYQEPRVRITYSENFGLRVQTRNSYWWPYTTTYQW